MLEDLAHRPGVAEVADPFESGSISADASIAYADVTYAMPVEEVPLSAFDDMESAALVAEDVGLGVEFGGEVWADHAEEAEVPAELIGLGFAVLVLLLSFRSDRKSTRLNPST